MVDVYGFRIIVDDVNTCYRVLGIVHGLYKPMPGRFKDYIAIPRVNGYQSLHTTLFGPKGLPLEVQIRTTDMDRVAESGVAAHWQYKAMTNRQRRRSGAPGIGWRDLRKYSRRARPKSFSKALKSTFSRTRFTSSLRRATSCRCRRARPSSTSPTRYIPTLAIAASPAKVDRTLVPLRTVLQNSQTVEIITARGAKPNPNWVTFVATAKARSAIRQYMKNMRTTESVDLGKRLLDRSLKDLGSSLRKVGKVRLREALDELGLDDATDLYEQLGLGERLAPLTARFLIGEKGEQAEPKSASLVIAGTEGMVVSYAKCCYPIPGDDVMGYLSAGRGVVIHRNSCGNLINFRKQPEKWLSVGWEEDIDRDFSSQIQVETVNKTGVLAEVAAVIADSQSNIEEVSVNIRHQDTSAMTFLLQVKDRTHLAHIMRNVRKMQNVIRVSRDSA